MKTTARIELEHWEGPNLRRERFECSSLQTVVESLARLDGKRIDSMSMELDGVGTLTIGGGPDLFIIVSFPVDGSSSHAEHNGPEAGNVEVQVGGQTGNYSAAMVFFFNSARAIAERFFCEGKFDSSVKWIQDCPPQ